MKKFIFNTALILCLAGSVSAKNSFNYMDSIFKEHESSIYIEIANTTNNRYTPEQCATECNEHYSRCYQSGEDDRTCSIDLRECVWDCFNY